MPAAVIQRVPRCKMRWRRWRVGYGLSFSSGMAAIDTLLRLVQPGEHVLVGNDVYGGTYRLFTKVLAGYGIDFDFIEMSDLAVVESAFRPKTRLVWLETPTNPLLKLFDIAAIADMAHANGAQFAVDNTFASPALQQPLPTGAPISLSQHDKIHWRSL